MSRRMVIGITSGFLLMCAHAAFADTHEISTPTTQQGAVNNASAYTPFTGKITKSKVRLRLQPGLEGTILKELNKDDLLVIVGEQDDFYAVEPPTDIKVYVYRTFILDNTVEGNKVNVRSEPDLEAPIVAQLNSGDKVEGHVSALNNRWLEISPPPTTRFYVCKEYVERLGDASVINQLKQRRWDVNQLLKTAYLLSESEMQKPFQQISIEPIVSLYQRIIQDFTDFPEQSARAKELLGSLQEEYLQKKIAYLEQKSQQDDKGDSEDDAVAAEVIPPPSPSIIPQPVAAPYRSNGWASVEERYYQQLAEESGKSVADLRADEHQQALVVRGVIELYNRPVKNKPGDFLLINRASRLPIAYLYSIDEDLQSRLGQEVTLQVVPRPNNHFAFPAYKVLSVE